MDKIVVFVGDSQYMNKYLVSIVFTEPSIPF